LIGHSIRLATVVVAALAALVVVAAGTAFAHVEVSIDNLCARFLPVAPIIVGE
jgi:hypothetical protein